MFVSHEGDNRLCDVGRGRGCITFGVLFNNYFFGSICLGLLQYSVYLEEFRNFPYTLAYIFLK